MSQLYFYLLIATAILYVFKIIERKINLNIKTNNYKKRISIMTPAEQRYFRQLQQEYGGKYFIFPQINIDKLIQVDRSLNGYKARNRINQKSVDFVLVDKETLSTQLVIELDDWTHKLKNRQERDRFVEEVLRKCDIELKRIIS